MNKKNDQPRLLDWWWYVLVLFPLLLLGIILLVINCQVPDGIWRLSSDVRTDRWSILFGIYLVSVVVTHLVIYFSMRGLNRLFYLKGGKREDNWTPALVGICESIMYPTALLMGQPSFIGIWLAVKVAGQWIRWSGKSVEDIAKAPDIEKANEGRRRFNAFLIGNALSIIAAGVTYGALRIWVLKDV